MHITKNIITQATKEARSGNPAQMRLIVGAICQHVLDEEVGQRQTWYTYDFGYGGIANGMRDGLVAIQTDTIQRAKILSGCIRILLGEEIFEDDVDPYDDLVPMSEVADCVSMSDFMFSTKPPYKTSTIFPELTNAHVYSADDILERIKCLPRM